MNCPKRCYCSNFIKNSLGEYIYKALMNVQLPPNHPSLYDSLYKAFTCGLPAGHISLIEIIKTKL